MGQVLAAMLCCVHRLAGWSWLLFCHKGANKIKEEPLPPSQVIQGMYPCALLDTVSDVVGGWEVPLADGV